jgi:uncharacterized protein (UPF0147 family)
MGSGIGSRRRVHRASAASQMHCDPTTDDWERFDIDAAEAFARLKQMSQDRNTPIARVAQRVAGGDSLLFK